MKYLIVALITLAFIFATTTAAVTQWGQVLQYGNATLQDLTPLSTR